MGPAAPRPPAPPWPRRLQPGRVRRAAGARAGQVLPQAARGGPGWLGRRWCECRAIVREYGNCGGGRRGLDGCRRVVDLQEVLPGQPEHARADADDVALGQLCFLDPLTVHVRAVGAAQVHDPQAGPVAVQLGVVPRGAGVRDHDVALRRPPDPHDLRDGRPGVPPGAGGGAGPRVSGAAGMAAGPMVAAPGGRTCGPGCAASGETAPGAGAAAVPGQAGGVQRPAAGQARRQAGAGPGMARTAPARPSPRPWSPPWLAGRAAGTQAAPGSARPPSWRPWPAGPVTAARRTAPAGR